MSDAVSLLFEAMKKKYPYQPISQAEQLYAEQADNAYASLIEQQPDLNHQLWSFRDCLETASFYQCLYYFSLGLELGLSLSREFPSTCES